MAIFPNSMGPAELTYDGVVLGNTKGGINFRYSEETATATVDKTGDTPRAKVVTKAECMVTGALAESALSQLAKLVGGSVTGSTKLVLANRVGKDLVTAAKTLIIKPIVDGAATADTTKWVYIPKSSVVPKFEVTYNLADQKVWAFEFEGHPVTADDVASGGSLAGQGYSEGDIAVLGATT